MNFLPHFLSLLALFIPSCRFRFVCDTVLRVYSSLYFTLFPLMLSLGAFVMLNFRSRTGKLFYYFAFLSLVVAVRFLFFRAVRSISLLVFRGLTTPKLS